MIAHRPTVVAFAGACLALAALVILGNRPGSPGTALAGPCDAPPEVYSEHDPPPDGEPLSDFPIFVESGLNYIRQFHIVTFPEDLPLSKIEISVTSITGPDDLDIQSSLVSDAFGISAFITVEVGDTVLAGSYIYQIDVDCHGMVTSLFVDVWVDICPEFSRGPAGESTPTPIPLPEDCEEGTPTPTASPTGDSPVWGDSNCDAVVNPIDSLFVLRFDAGFETDTEPCPPMGEEFAPPLIWGDWNCDNVVNPIDSLMVLRFDVGLGANQQEPCPGFEQEVEDD